MGLAQAIADGVWGQGFPGPVFDGEFDVLEQRAVNERHRRLSLLHGGRRCDAVAFNQPDGLPARIRAAYRLDVHHYQGLANVQLVLERWEAA